MKVLFVCAAGCNRSHALALNSKMMYGFDAIAVGIWANPSVFPMLSAWADRIVLVERWTPEHFIPKEHCRKVSILEMGADRWGHVGHPEMHLLAQTLLKMWGSTGWQAGIVVYNTAPLKTDLLDWTGVVPSGKVEELGKLMTRKET
jgi:hypothetical protein